LPKRARCPFCDQLFNRDILDSHIAKCRAQKTRHNSDSHTIRRRVVVDGSNVAYHLSPHGQPKAQNLLLAYQSLRAAGFDAVFVISAALIHSVDKPSLLDSFILIADTIEAPKGTDDDLKIIQLSKKLDADIISNDRFLNWQERFPWLASRLRRYRMTPSGLILTK